MIPVLFVISSGCTYAGYGSQAYEPCDNYLTISFNVESGKYIPAFWVISKECDTHNKQITNLPKTDVIFISNNALFERIKTSVNVESSEPGFRNTTIQVGLRDKIIISIDDGVMILTNILKMIDDDNVTQEVTRRVINRLPAIKETERNIGHP
jgi:hypothetical protein